MTSEPTVPLSLSAEALSSSHCKKQLAVVLQTITVVVQSRLLPLLESHPTPCHPTAFCPATPAGVCIEPGLLLQTSPSDM